MLQMVPKFTTLLMVICYTCNCYIKQSTLVNVDQIFCFSNDRSTKLICIYFNKHFTLHFLLLSVINYFCYFSDDLIIHYLLTSHQ